WGESTMAAVMHLDPNTQIPEESVAHEIFLMVMDGEVDLNINEVSMRMISLNREAPDGIHSGTPRNDLILLEKGAKYALTAGTNGAKIMEVNSSLRADYLQKTGIKDSPSNTGLETEQSPNLATNKVHNL